jgi:hypothetical protein
MSGLASLLAGRRAAGLYVWHSHLPLGDVAHAAEHARWQPFVVDGRMVTSKRDLLDAMATACNFPDSFGYDWPALAACLTDLSWALPTRGFLLVYDGWGMLARTELDTWTTARGILQHACAHWAATSSPFAVILRGPGPDHDLPELA